MLDPYTYRCPAGHPDPCPVCTGAPHLEEILQYEGPHTVAAVILETVVGTNGVIVPPDGYLAVDPRGLRPARDPAHLRRGDGRLRPHRQLVRLRALGRRPGHPHGREGDQLRLRAARRDGRLGADLPDWVRDKFFAGGLTYSGHPLACASGGRLDRGLPRGGHRRERGRAWASSRRGAARARRAASVDRRGARARPLLGVELVKNRETREPLVPFNATGEALAPSPGSRRRRSSAAST